MVFAPIENLMKIEEVPHLDENAIEGYAMRSLDLDAAAEVEQHLLFCEICRDRILEADAYILAMKRATPRLPIEVERQRWGFRFLAPAFRRGVAAAGRRRHSVHPVCGGSRSRCGNASRHARDVGSAGTRPPPVAVAAGS